MMNPKSLLLLKKLEPPMPVAALVGKRGNLAGFLFPPGSRYERIPRRAGTPWAEGDIIATMHVVPGIEIPLEKITAFCAKWNIREFSLFGSALRSDFRPDSDVDVLVSFQKDAGWSLWDLFDMRDELKAIFGREVDLVEKEGLRNPLRRHEILTTRQVVYAA